MILFFYEKRLLRAEKKPPGKLREKEQNPEKKNPAHRKTPKTRFFSIQNKNEMRLEDVQMHLQKRTHKDLYLGQNKSLADGPNDEEIQIAKMNEVRHQWQFHDEGPSKTLPLDLHDLQDFGEHDFNEISLNAMLDTPQPPKSIEIKQEPTTPEKLKTPPLLAKPSPKPMSLKAASFSRSQHAQSFLLNPSKWDNYRVLFDSVNERLQTTYNTTMDSTTFDVSLKYIYIEAMKVFEPDFFVNTKREDSNFREITENCLEAYKKELDDLLNRLAGSVREPFSKFIESITDDHIFAASEPYLETRTPKEYFCFVTGEKIPRGSKAFVLTLYKNTGSLIKDVPCHIKWHQNPLCPTLFVDMAMALASFLTLCCLILGKIVHYPSQDKTESPEVSFYRFLGDTKEMTDLIVFQHEVITAAKKCHKWTDSSFPSR